MENEKKSFGIDDIFGWLVSAFVAFIFLIVGIWLGRWLSYAIIHILPWPQF